jgi:hypothetical protein
MIGVAISYQNMQNSNNKAQKHGKYTKSKLHAIKVTKSINVIVNPQRCGQFGPMLLPTVGPSLSVL